MKFKAGDKVRLTREGIKKHIQNKWKIDEVLIDGLVVREVASITFTGVNSFIYYTEDFELVPEEPEFKQGKLIEVRDREDADWKKNIFICKIPGKVGNPYIAVANCTNDQYHNNKKFYIHSWKYARKLRPQLTRKEIAEKFGVSEDFTLID